MISTGIRKAIVRGTAAGLIAVIMASAAVGCGQKEEPAAQTPVQEESAAEETKEEEPVDPEQVNEEAMEAIKEEEAGKEQEKAAEEAAEGQKEADKEKAEEEKAQEEKQDPAVIEKPEPSQEEQAEQEVDQAEEDEKKKDKSEDEASGKKASKGNLDMLDGAMTFDKMELAFPIELDSMSLGSWKLEYENVSDPSSKVLAPSEVVTASMTCDKYAAEDVKVTAEFGNYSDESVNLTDLPMTGIYIEKGKGKDGKEPVLPEVELPGGLTWGSTESEIRDLFGEASFSGTFDRDFDFMYENGSYYLELAGMDDGGLDYMVYSME